MSVISYVPSSRPTAAACCSRQTASPCRGTPLSRSRCRSPAVNSAARRLTLLCLRRRTHAPKQLCRSARVVSVHDMTRAPKSAASGEAPSKRPSCGSPADILKAEQQGLLQEFTGAEDHRLELRAVAVVRPVVQARRNLGAFEIERPVLVDQRQRCRLEMT